jgi:methylmalonyl-CoA mutase N-terminal domain/subunit
VPLLRIDEAGYHRQLERLRSVRRTRDNRAVSQRLLDLAHAARREDANLMAPLLAAVNEYATLQEMMDVLREAWGVYEEPVIL